MKLNSAATEQGHFSHTPRAVSPTVAAVGRLVMRSRTTNIGRKSILIWWVARENGWTPCRTHNHKTPEAAVECWQSGGRNG